MRTPSILLLGVFALALFSCGKSGDDGFFEAYDANALAAATRAGQPTIIFVTADWCGPCKTLKGGVLKQDDVRAAFASFKRLKIDLSDRGDQAANRAASALGVEGIPTVIFQNAEGEETGRLIGPRAAADYLAAAQEASRL